MKTGRILLIPVFLILLLSGVVLQAEEDAESQKLFKKAESYFFQKKFEMAEMLLQEVLKKDPENGKAYSYLGDIMLRNKRYDAALNLYKKAVDLNSDLAENHFRMGQIYYQKKKGGLALENFETSLEKDKNLKYAYYHMGLTQLVLMRNKESTIKNWETYLSLAPEDPQYEKIRRAIELLKDPKFVIPPADSEISIEEALLLGGTTLDKQDRTARDSQAGDETRKTNTKIKDIYIDDDL